MTVDEEGGCEAKRPNFKTILSVALGSVAEQAMCSIFHGEGGLIVLLKI